MNFVAREKNWWCEKLKKEFHYLGISRYRSAGRDRGNGTAGVQGTGDAPDQGQRARLRVAARYIKMGIVKFPRTGCEQLITQLLGVGIEKHDNAVDALVYLILGLVGEGIEEQKVHYV
jgi:hypothetical protein